MKTYLKAAVAGALIAGVVGVLWPESVPWSGIAVGAIVGFFVALS